MNNTIKMSANEDASVNVVFSNGSLNDDIFRCYPVFDFRVAGIIEDWLMAGELPEE